MILQMQVGLLSAASFPDRKTWGRTELGSTPSPSGSAAFLPVDFRIGWQPGARKNRRFAFKLEAGLYGTTYGEKNSKKTIFLVSPRTTIGLAVRF